jgi:surface protein
MGKMFEGCQSLVSINLTHFKTGNVVNMNSMFAHCVKLKSLNLTGFNTSAVKTMDYMFYNCSSLNSLDLSDFNLLQVISNNQMLTSLKNINYINLFGIQENGQISSSGINTDTNIQKVFFVCQKTNLITHSKSYNCCDYYNNEAQCDYPLETTKIIINIENITNITEQIETIYNSVIKNLKDQAYKVVQTKNLVLQYSTVKEQLNNKSQMVSSVDLGKCEDLLREQEGLNETEESLWLKWI